MKQSMYKNGLFSPSCFTDHGLEAESTFGRVDESLRPIKIVHISRVILYESSPLFEFRKGACHARFSSLI